MIRIMFVCHGNICRSPMAEFVLKDIVNKRGLEDNFFIASSATSTEEIGNPVHRGTRDKILKTRLQSFLISQILQGTLQIPGTQVILMRPMMI
ncbi:Low molecular weight protein-tyrosine-phosphatase YfkJ [Clostridium ragsdalei P11]|uniref:protein-tyrosine-phosphatase n=1 Tax=Clostridium ragsdalei P11 TaxID=1353534 RepID=A0A1A6AYQ2_9CLOT|nr:Low molecular weight protein-tyrosine-phosphatase YfkJ [Clostridium ragsdalei P11]